MLSSIGCVQYSTITKNLINMCLKPSKIRNPVSVISRNGGQKAYIEVPCGHCADCKKSARLAWRFRSHHHVKNCLTHGGFVYFDTLTYDEQHVPRLSHYVPIKKTEIRIDSKGKKYEHVIYELPDVYVFDNSHWRNFLKNLRRQLDYHYKGVKFTYFLTSEYGTDERYTHRPHYHVLFFVNSTRLIDNYTFSSLVSKCWPYGRTDGLPYQSNLYVDEHTYTSPHEDTMKLCNYVSKYVTKDSTFQKVIDNRLSVLKKHLDEETFNTLKRQVNMFHRQSQGYGKSFLDTLTSDDIDDLCDKNVVHISDSEKIVVQLALPQYYKRHLFYKLHRDDEGKYYWQPNQRGIEYLRKSFKRNIDTLEQKYNNIYINLPDIDKIYIDTLLNGRTFRDLSFYQIIYKDRFRPYYNSPACSLTYNELPDRYIDTILQTAFVHEETFNDIIHRDTDRGTIYVPIYNNRFFNQLTKEIDYDTFIKQNIITEHSCSSFANFDKLISFISNTQLEDNRLTQITFDYIEELQQKFKHLLIYGN